MNFHPQLDRSTVHEDLDDRIPVEGGRIGAPICPQAQRL